MRLSYSVFGSLFLLPAWACSMFILMHFSQVCICTTVILDQKLFSICDVPQFFLGVGRGVRIQKKKILLSIRLPSPPIIFIDIWQTPPHPPPPLSRWVGIMWMAPKNRSLRTPRKCPWKSDFPIGRKTKKVPEAIFEKCPRHLRGNPLWFPKQCQRNVDSVREYFETRNFHDKKKLHE